MPELTITYQIQEDGDCSSCKSNPYAGYCQAFNEVLYKSEHKKTFQCQACKDFLTVEASRVYCGEYNKIDELVKKINRR
jgi:hypothetical protein